MPRPQHPCSWETGTCYYARHGVSWAFCLGWPTVILSIFASWVTEIAGWAYIKILKLDTLDSVWWLKLIGLRDAWEICKAHLWVHLWGHFQRPLTHKTAPEGKSTVLNVGWACNRLQPRWNKGARRRRQSLHVNSSPLARVSTAVGMAHGLSDSSFCKLAIQTHIRRLSRPSVSGWIGIIGFLVLRLPAWTEHLLGHWLKILFTILCF
jgi:hypothetical protein